MDTKHKTFLVVGAGKSGIAATDLLVGRGALVILFDGNANLDKEELLAAHPAWKRVEVICKELPADIAKRVDIAVLSPGVPTDLPEVSSLREAGVTIWGEIELAYRLGRGRIAAITGTNGKTTTTTLAGEILKLAYEDVRVVGNIGIPYTQVADSTAEDTVIVAEISSFQLETIDAFSPEVTAILNISPDHLNRHHTMENYIAAKERIAENQKETDVCVLNYEDPVLREFGKTLSCRVVYFSSARALPDGYYYREGAIYQARDGESERLLGVKELQIPGLHNYENAMAAIALCDAMGVPMELILQGLKAFQAVEHRIEYVCTKRGVRYYNDSKGTNPDAAIKGICAMDAPTVLIGGGYDKDSSYDAWIESFGGRVKWLVLLGQTREKIAACAKKHGFENIILVDSLEEAIDVSCRKAEPGDCVLLSPACASWGMFDNYEQRGNVFKEYVRALKE